MKARTRLTAPSARRSGRQRGVAGRAEKARREGLGGPWRGLTIVTTATQC